MKRLTVFVPLVSLSSAAQSSGIGSALGQLCVLSQTLFGLLAMILIVLAPVTAGIGVLIYVFTKGKHRIAELIGKVVIGLGILFAIGAVLLVIIYLITPWTISFLTGGEAMADPTNPCSFNV